MKKSTRGKSPLEVRVDSAFYKMAPPKLTQSSWWGMCLLLVKTATLVLFFYSCSISLTFYNKWLFQRFRFPLSITVIHLTVKFVLAAMVRTCLGCVAEKNNITLSWSVYMKRVAPTGFCSVLDIGLSNWSLLYITVSLYTMSKSTAIISILLFGIVFGLQRAHVSQIIIVMLIAGGLFMFTYESTQFNEEGFILVIVAAVISGVRWSFAQILTQKEELGLSNPVHTIYHLQPVMIAGLMPFALIVEGLSNPVHTIYHLQPVMIAGLMPFALIVEGLPICSTKLFLGFTDVKVFLYTWVTLLAGAVLAFMLAMSEYLLLSRTSSLTLSISGIFKEICTLYLATQYSGDTMSVLNFFGMLICLSGITLHIILKAFASKDKSGSKNENLQADDRVELLTTDGTANDSEDEEERECAKRMHVTRL